MRFLCVLSCLSRLGNDYDHLSSFSSFSHTFSSATMSSRKEISRIWFSISLVEMFSKFWWSRFDDLYQFMISWKYVVESINIKKIIEVIRTPTIFIPEAAKSIQKHVVQHMLHNLLELTRRLLDDKYLNNNFDISSLTSYREYFCVALQKSTSLFKWSFWYKILKFSRVHVVINDIIILVTSVQRSSKKKKVSLCCDVRVILGLIFIKNNKDMGRQLFWYRNWILY